ncbi:MAG: S41 family peptidase [Ferruginibacter sp.]
MRFFTFTIIVCYIFLSGCYAKEDIEFKKFDETQLKQDIEILKGIVTDMHAGAYAYNSPAALNKLFDSVKNSINTPLTTRLFFNKVNYILDRLKCIHTDAYLPDEYYDSISKRAVFFPTPLVNINGRLYVNSDVQDIPLGAQVLSINDIPASKIINDLQFFRHADGNSFAIRKTAIDEDFSYNYFIAYGDAAEFSIDFIKDSSIKTETKIFEAQKLTDLYANRNNTSFYYFPTDVDYDFEIDDNYKTATLTLRSLNFYSYNAVHAFNNFLSNSFRLIKQNGIKNLIIDCRNNGGGYYTPTYSLLSYLVHKKLPEYDSATQRFEKLSYTQYIAPEDTDKIEEQDSAFLSYKKLCKGLYTLNTDEITQWVPQKERFKGQIYVVTNGQVISAAATLVAVLKDKTNAVIVGEETGGGNDAHNAGMVNFILPHSKIKVEIPTRRYYQPIVKKQAGRGVLPNKEILFTLKDLLNNTDSPLSYIYDSLIVK